MTPEHLLLRSVPSTCRRLALHSELEIEGRGLSLEVQPLVRLGEASTDTEELRTEAARLFAPAKGSSKC